jgi:hypothetical protein
LRRASLVSSPPRPPLFCFPSFGFSVPPCRFFRSGCAVFSGGVGGAFGYGFGLRRGGSGLGSRLDAPVGGPGGLARCATEKADGCPQATTADKGTQCPRQTGEKTPTRTNQTIDPIKYTWLSDTRKNESRTGSPAGGRGNRQRGIHEAATNADGRLNQSEA